MNADKLSLTVPTNRTVKGPMFRKDGEAVIVEYDYESDDGSCCWSRVAFIEVIDFEYRQVACCSADDIIGSKDILRLSRSDRLTVVLNRWEDFVGKDEWQAKQGGADRFKHFKVFFDDAGCIDVVASACEEEKGIRERKKGTQLFPEG